MSGVVPKWLERFVTGDPAGSGEGTLWTLRNSWPLPPWVTLLLLVFCLGFVVWAYMRETGSAGKGYRLMLAALRAASIAIVLFMLAQFLLSLERTGLPYVVVIIDDSGSMKTQDRYTDDKLREALKQQLARAELRDPTRLNLAKSLLLEDKAALLRAIDDRYKLKVYFLDDVARAQSGELDGLLANIRNLQPTGEATRLGLGVRTVLNDLRGTPPTAIVLFSDGVNTEGESLADAAAYARRKGVPLFTVGMGSETPVRDLELSDLLVDDVVFVDDVVNFEFKLTATGYEGRRLKVSLRQQGDDEPLASLTVTGGPDGKPQPIRIPYRPTKVGDFEYAVDVEHLDDELHADNNRQQRPVSVRKQQIRVLLVQSYPNFEFRYLKQMLHRDSTISLKTVLQEADLQYADIDASALRVFPERKEDLYEYDVVIFGDVDPSFLSASAMQNLSTFVTQKGGGLVFIAGPHFTPASYRDTPLGTLVPIDFNGASGPDLAEVITEGYRVEPTDLGEAVPALQLGDSAAENVEIWRRLPPLYWLFEAPTLKPAARVLAHRVAADGRALPVICLQYVGAGKVVFHATDETWRWRFRLGDIYFARYWVQTLRYLSRARLLGKDRSAELAGDRRVYRRGESPRLRVRFVDERRAPAEDDGVTVIVEQQGHQNRRVVLRRNPSSRGVFEGVLSSPPVGKYHAWVAAPTFDEGVSPIDFLVEAPPGEFERVQMETGELKAAAEVTKGRSYTLANATELLGDLPSGHQVPIEALPPLVLWNRWPLVLLFLTLLVSEWVLRKRKGML
jgi:uncharacterized membrane protein